MGVREYYSEELKEELEARGYTVLDRDDDMPEEELDDHDLGLLQEIKHAFIFASWEQRKEIYNLTMKHRNK